MVKKRFIVLIVLVVLISIVIVAVFRMPSASKKSGAEEVVATTQSEQIADTDPVTTSSSKYIAYSPASFQSSSDKKRVLFFYASWCPTCRPADAAFQENAAKIPDDVRLFRVNYNDSDTDASEKELAREYRVTYQHTFVLVDSEGKEIKKWNGGQLDELLVNSK